MKKVGVAITTFNERSRLQACLKSLYSCEIDNIYIHVTDNNSTDGTLEMVETEFPKCGVTVGGGELWWTGGTNRSVRECLDHGCEYVLLLNADAVIQRASFLRLLQTAEENYPAIIASLVVTKENVDRIWWAGSSWGKLAPALPVWTSRYQYKNKASVHDIPKIPFETSEAHGRGVLIPKQIFAEVGLFNEDLYPHYGADMDFSFRVRRHGYKILVDPGAIVELDVSSTGMKRSKRLFVESIREYKNYMFSRKNGEAIRIWWHLTKTYLPFPDSLLTYFFVLLLNSLRFWTMK